MSGPLPLVTRREVTERLRAKSFLISTGIYLLVALASVVIPHLADSKKTVYGVGLTGPDAPALERSLGQLAPTLDVHIRVQRLPDATLATEAVRAKRLTVALVDGNRVVARGDLPASLRVLLNTAVYQVQLARQIGAEVTALPSPQALPEQRLSEAKPLRTKNRPLAYAGVIIIYLLLLTYGFTVANGVLEEKSSRVSEVLLGALRPSQLLAGKVVGIGMVALVQLLIVGLPTVGVALALGSFHVPSGTPLTLASVIMWALLGYGLYSCVFAAAGAAASRPEDIGNATAPITILIAVTYFAAIACTQAPDDRLARVVSFIPFMAPMTMLPRAAVGHVAWWEVPLSVAIVLVTTYLTTWLGARIYAGGIRRPGPRVKWREAWRAAAS
jgi:ABC-2 type transport system permease protein